jgi:hypothetical protein
MFVVVVTVEECRKRTAGDAKLAGKVSGKLSGRDCSNELLRVDDDESGIERYANHDIARDDVQVVLLPHGSH